MVLEDDEEIHVRVKIRPSVMESAAHADVLVDANVLHALATADALNLAAQRSADLVVVYADVKWIKIKNMTYYFLLHNYIIKNNLTIYSHNTE